jgi:hypothetical protein
MNDSAELSSRQKAAGGQHNKMVAAAHGSGMMLGNVAIP